MSCDIKIHVYWKCNLPMTPHVLQLVGELVCWLVGWSVGLLVCLLYFPKWAFQNSYWSTVQYLLPSDFRAGGERKKLEKQGSARET